MRTSLVRMTAVCVAVALLAGCRQGDAEQARVAELEAGLTAARERVAELEAALAEAEEPDPGEPQGPQPAPPHSPEGLVEQLHSYLDGGVEGGDPASTGWQPADVPEGFAQPDEGGYETPGELVHALAGEFAAAQLGADLWELTVRVLEGEADEATAAVLTWGLADDAVVGSDLRLYLARGDAGWYVESAEERVHCRRGVSDGLCV